MLSFPNQTNIILDQLIMGDRHMIISKSLDPQTRKVYLVFLNIELQEIYSGPKSQLSDLKHFAIEVPPTLSEAKFHVDNMMSPESPEVEIVLHFN